MYGVISPFDRLATAPALKGTHGVAGIAYAYADGASRLATLEQRSPLRVLFPRPAAGDIPQAALITTSGGMVGGDTLDIAVSVGPGASALVIGQAAEKVYRSQGADCRIDVLLQVDDGGWLEWLPQETILFDGARLRRQTTVAVADGGQALAGEILVFGRVARGETVTRGLVRDAWRVSLDDRLVWADALHMDPDDIAHCLEAPAGFGGARAAATAVYVGPDTADRLALARDLAEREGVKAGATCCGPVLVVRWLGAEPSRVRDAFEAFWTGFRAEVGRLPGRLPRLWYV
ncbi:MAG: urease accessory protein UreD [Pseudomonadota bacterium]